MDELVIGGKKYISSKRASEFTGYAKDYIGQLARGGKIPATRIGRAWYVDEAALALHASIGEEESLEVTDKDIYSDTESTKIVLQKVAVPEKKIPTVSHAFSRAGRTLPSTWDPISYYSDETTLFPGTLDGVFKNHSSVSNAFENKEISAIQEKNNLRIRILKAKTGTETPKVLFDTPKPVVPEKKVIDTKISPLRKSSQKKVRNYTFLHYSLLATGATVFALCVLGSGLLVSSHINFVPSSGAYTANAYVSYQYAQDAIREIPGLQIGYDSLKGFFLFLKDSPSTLFFKGADFLKYLINLV